ncbi:MAG: DDE-type integrase/transposase/recombinase [Actinomycetota bacterium]
MAERKAVTREMAKRYQRASKKQKGRLLDELCALTGWSRRHARRALAQALVGNPVRARPPRRRVYGPEVLDPLRKVWATLDGPAGKRLAPFMTEIVEVLERCGELSVAPGVRKKLLRVSAATIDRMLAPERKRLQLKGRSGTKAGSMLKRQIPIRTFAEWDEARPGFCEADLVAHDGGDPRGEFCHTLDLTCVATGWTEPRAIKNKAQRWVRQALVDIEAALPFPLRGLDCDNGSEFINVELFRWCEENQITFTRSRPYRKNDNCFVEQKNWPVVRQQVGYLRYDTEAELECLRELYAHLRLYVNFFQPQMKLVSKTRQGAKVRKRYDTPRTPYQRVLASPHLPGEAKEALTTIYPGLNPVELKRHIGRCQDRLLEIAKIKPERRKEVSNPPDHPFRASYGWREISRTSLVRQPETTSRTS